MAQSEWTVSRVDRDVKIEFVVCENGSAVIAAEVWPPSERYGGLAPAEVSWPSTSDKRAEMAQHFALAVQMASDEALRTNAAAGL
jgi:hypothetical protein